MHVNNLFYSNGTNIPNVSGAPVNYTISNNVFENPMFIDPVPQNGDVDIGAY